jgi:hypothetical protein
MESLSDPLPEVLRLGGTRSIALWILFFLISFGLGYPTLNRYDARTADTDVISYYKMVANDPPPTTEDNPFRFRVLVPSIAKPFYLLAKGKLGTWNPVFFGLLVSNCLFTASAALFLLLVAVRVLGDLPTAMLGCTLFLLNYVVANLWLSGLVDSSEGCLLLAVTWSLLSRRWWLLPLIGMVGGIAKQSFLPFSVLFASTWWLTTERSRRTYAQLLWVAALGLTATASLGLTHWKIAGQFLWPWTMATLWEEGGMRITSSCGSPTIAFGMLLSGFCRWESGASTGFRSLGLQLPSSQQRSRSGWPSIQTSAELSTDQSSMSSVLY